MKVLVHHGARLLKANIWSKGGRLTTSTASNPHFQFTRRLVSQYVRKSVCTSGRRPSRSSDVNITRRNNNASKLSNVRKIKVKHALSTQFEQCSNSSLLLNSLKNCRDAKRTNVSIYELTIAKEIEWEDCYVLSTHWPTALVSTYLEDTLPPPRAAVPIPRDGNLRHGGGLFNLNALLSHKISVRNCSAKRDERFVENLGVGQHDDQRVGAGGVALHALQRQRLEHGGQEKGAGGTRQLHGKKRLICVRIFLPNWRGKETYLVHIKIFCSKCKLCWKRCFQPSKSSYQDGTRAVYNHCSNVRIEQPEDVSGVLGDTTVAKHQRETHRSDQRLQSHHRIDLQILTSYIALSARDLCEGNANHLVNYPLSAVIVDLDGELKLRRLRRPSGQGRVAIEVQRCSAGWKQCFQQPHNSCHVSIGKSYLIFRSCVMYHMGKRNYNTIIING